MLGKKKGNDCPASQDGKGRNDALEKEANGG